MQSNETVWTIPATPLPGNASAFDCFGPFCVLGVGSSIYVVEQPSMRVVSCLSGGHSPQSTITFVTCSQSRLSSAAGGGEAGATRKAVVASGDDQGYIVTWILHEGIMLNVLSHQSQASRESTPRGDDSGARKSVKSICWSGSDSSLLVSLYHQNDVLVWDYLKGQRIWSSCLNPAREVSLTHMVQCPFDNTCLCVTNDEGLLYILFVADSEEEKIHQVEYKISASDSKFMRCKFGTVENLLHIVLEHTLIAFDVDYGIPAGSAALAKRHKAFQDILAVHPEGNLILCAHQDASVSTWECNESKTVYTLLGLVSTVSMGGHVPRSAVVQVRADCKMHSADFGPKVEVFVTTANADTGGYLHRFSLRDFRDISNLKLEGMARLLPQQCTAFALQPPDDRGDSEMFALGTQIGTVEVVDLMRGRIVRSFRVHKGPLLGVKWLTKDLILSFSVEKTGETAFANHIVVLNVTYGTKRVLRGAQTDSSSLRGVRIPGSGNHFLLLFKNGISELWRVDKPGHAGQSPTVAASVGGCTRIRVMNMPFTCVEFVQGIPPFFSPRVPAPGRRESLDGSQTSTSNLNNSLGTLMSSAENSNQSRRLSHSQAEALEGASRDILLFALPDRTLGAVEVPIESKKLRDLRPDFPVIDIPPGEVVSALACNQETLIVGTSSGDLRVWSQSKEDFGAYKLAQWEGSVRKVVMDPCSISTDFLAMSGKNMFHRINVDHMPLRIERKEGNLPGTEILDANWTKNSLGRQYLLCVREGVLIYSDQASRLTKKRPRHLLLDPKTPQRLAVYMQRGLPLGPSPAGGSGGVGSLDVSDQPYSQAFQEMAKNLEMAEIEARQAHETYRRFVAELAGCAEAIFPNGNLPSQGVTPLEAVKFIASKFSRTWEEYEFWNKMDDTLVNVVEGNFGGNGSLWDAARQKQVAAKSIYWHESYTGTLTGTKRERRVLEYFVLGDRESAIAFLLAASPDDTSSFYKDGLRALALSSFKTLKNKESSPREMDVGGKADASVLQEKACKVLSAHCSSHDDVLSSIVMLSLIGRPLDAVIQLQEVGMWEHAATMTASYLEGDQRQEALERWAAHVITVQKNLWRGLGILLSCGLYVEALDTMDKHGLSLSFLTLYQAVDRVYVRTKESGEGDQRFGAVLGTDNFVGLRKKHREILARMLCSDNSL